jgi:hypothetical protein
MNHDRGPGHVFVSHANADKARIRPLVERLLDENIPIWIDRPEELGLDERFLRCGRIRSGADWQGQIDAALEHSACVLFVLSRTSNLPDRSNALYREFQHGVRNDSLVMVSIDPKDDFEPLPHYRIRQSRDLGPWIAGDTVDRGAAARLLIVLQELREKVTEHRRKTGRGTDAEAERSPSLAPLLPYFTDRVNQQRRLSEALQRALSNELVPPMTFVALGTDDDCLDTFVQQVRYTRLPSLLASRLSGDRLFTATFVWSLDDSDTHADLEGEVHALVAEQLQLPVSASRRQIADRLSSAHGCWFLQLNLSLEAGSQRCCDALRAWVQWWTKAEFGGFRSPVVTLACVAAPSSWWLHLLAGRPMSRLRRDLQAHQQHTQIYVLPEFRRLRFNDVESVIHGLGEDFDREVFRRRLRHAFRFLGVLPGRKLSMYEAASCIKRLVADPVTKFNAGT